MEKPITTDNKWTIAVVAGLAALSLLPIWSSAYVPTLDGPVHLNITQILADWRTSGFPRLHAIFDLNIKPEPNWSVYLLLGLLAKLFSISTSERIVLSLYVLSMPFSFALFSRLINSKGRWWQSAVLAYLVVYNATFFFGFYNYSLSLPLFVICAGLYLRYVQVPSLRLGAIIAVTSLLLFFTHVLGWAVFALTGGAFFLWQIILIGRAGDGLMAMVRLSLRCLMPVLPTLLLMLIFMGHNSDRVLVYGNSDTGAVHRLVWLLSGAVLYGNSLLELACLAAGFAIAVIYGIVIVRAGGLLRSSLSDALIVAFAAIVLAAFAIPNMLFGGGLTAIRIQIFAYILPLLWLCANAQWKRRWAFASISAAAATLMIVETVQVHRMSRNFENVVAAGDAIEPQSTVLPLVLYPRGLDEMHRPISRGVTFLLHADNRIEMDRKAIGLRLSQASTVNFPIRYTAKASPYDHMRVVHSLLGGEIDMPSVWKRLPSEIASYEVISGQTVDYLLIVGTVTPEAAVIVEKLEKDLRGRYAKSSSSVKLPGYVLLRRTAAAAKSG
jgi:hypothetical protein